MPSLRRHRGAAASVGLLSLALALTGVTSVPTAAAADDVRENFIAGTPYRGDFADPTVMVDGGRYVASATTTANLNLPISTSTDLRTWVPRAPLPDHATYNPWRLYNEAMTQPPAWAAVKSRRSNVDLISQWAPSLVKLRGQYVAAFSAAVRLSPRHSCIGLATAPAATGPYTPTSSEPLVCFPRAALGAIDPDFFVDPRTGTPWLQWKNEGIARVQGPQLVTRQLTPAGTAFAPGSTTRVLLGTSQAWERGVVEKPSMIHRRGRYYLLYSGGNWFDRSYATGYAVCRSAVGPCRKPQRAPILRSGAGVAGPGGADAFRDRQGRMRFAYAAWDADRVGPTGTNVRRMYVGALAPRKGGRLLRVTDR